MSLARFCFRFPRLNFNSNAFKKKKKDKVIISKISLKVIKTDLFQNPARILLNMSFISHLYAQLKRVVRSDVVKCFNLYRIILPSIELSMP